MSRKYKSCTDVPDKVLVTRLRELAHAVSHRPNDSSLAEFSMRILAECGRDADLILADAANRLEDLAKYRLESITKP